MSGEVRPEASGHLVFPSNGGEHRIWWERFAREAASGPAETVCLLNGLAMHTRAWYHFLPELTGEYDVLLFDYLGQGRSSCPDEPYSIPGFCRHLAGILGHLEIPKIHLLGISYGGFVALDFARLHQERLHTLTLSGILLSHERLFQMYQDLSLRFYRAGPETFELYTRYMYEKIFGERFVRETPPETLEAMRARFEERYRDRLHCLIRLTRAQEPFFEALDRLLPEYRAIRTPVLILAGEQDRAIPPWAQSKLADVLPNSRFELIEGSGHVVYLERRAAFFARVRRFLRTRSPHPAAEAATG